MASKPKIAPPPPPVVSPPIDESVPAGTREDPYLYSDGTPIVYLDGEDQVAYTARVQAMIDAAQVPETPASPSSVAVDPDVPDPDVPDPDVPDAPQAIPGSDIPVAPAAPVIPTPADAPPVAAGSQTSPVVPPVPVVPMAASQQPAGVSDTDAGVLPGHFNTMDDYMDAQRAGAAAVDAAYAEQNANKTVAEMTPDEIAALEEADAVDALSVDDRLRRLEQHIGLRSPRAKA